MTTSQSPSEASGTAPTPEAAVQPGRALLERTVLDDAVARSRRDDQQSWGVRGWLGPIVALAALIVAGNVTAAVAAPHARGHGTAIGIGLSAVTEAAMLAILVAFGRPMAARGGGWRATFGLDRVRGRDWAPWIFGLLFVYAGRTAVGILAAALTDGRALREAENLRLAHPSPGSVVALGLVVVLLAPITEELMFRGLLLRTFMRRMRFWPAALLSSMLFGLFHTYEAPTLAGAITLAASVAVLGLGNCYLVRISGRLTPAIMVHASFNALALLVTVLVAR